MVSKEVLKYVARVYNFVFYMEMDNKKKLGENYYNCTSQVDRFKFPLLSLTIQY